MIPQFIPKTLTSEISLTQQLSFSNQTVPAAGTLQLTRDFNVQIACFLNPFGLAAPLATTIICGGHVAYCYVYVGAGAGVAVTMELWANHANGGVFQQVSANILAGGAPLAAGQGDVGRFEDAGAAWELRFILANAGGANATLVQVAIAVRTF